MAGNSRRSAFSPRTWSTETADARRLTRPLRVEHLEDRSVPAIVLDGIPTWQEAGPQPIQNAQVTIPAAGASPKDPSTGAAQAVAPHPTDANILFAGGAGGGVWRTTNALATTPTWQSLTELMPSLSVGDISIDPANPNRMLISVGDTYGSSIVGSTLRGDMIGAIYTDNALAPVPRFQTLTGAGANTIAGGSLTSAIVRTNYMLVAGEKGVYRSSDNGVTWQWLSGTGNLPAGRMFNAVADLGNPSRVYAAGPSGIWRCDNILAATPVWGNFAQGNQLISANTNNIKLAIHNSGLTNVVYAAVVNPGGGFGNQLATLTYSTDQGSTWTNMDLPVQMTQSVGITGATNAGPIVITSLNHGLQSGQRVFVSGVGGNTNANGVYTITVTGPDTFSLNGSNGNGTYTANTGAWQLIYGIHPYGNGDDYLSLVADPNDANLVYIGGTKQQDTNAHSFPNASNSNGAFRFTGNLFRGNRSFRRQFTSPPLTPQQAEPLSPQWQPLVNSFTSTPSPGTAPHNRSRDLAIDAAGNLIEGDDGGVYKRTSPVNSLGTWSSLVGNLDLGTFMSVSQDSKNNVVFGGASANGIIGQASGTGITGSTLWDNVKVGDGGQTDVDTTTSPGIVYRYGYTDETEQAGTFLRNVHDTSNNLLSANVQVKLAAPATPNTIDSGLVAADAGTENFEFKFVLNAVDPNLMLLGFTNVYEDANPAGLAGDTITKITPAVNFKGNVSALSYGGTRLGATSPEVAFVGTSAGQLWIRGAGAANFTNRSITGATGEIRDIVLDPDDWQTAYVLQGSRIYITSNGGVSFTEITNNLLGTTLDSSGNVSDGLSTDVRTIALWDPFPGTAAGEEILLAGGRGGVFRRVPNVVSGANATRPWLEYGTELPNALVYDLDLVGNRLVAGTFGRGAWVVPDVSPTINARAVVTVLGDANNNNLTMYPYESNPAYTIVTDGMGNVGRIERTVVQEFRMIGGAGADNITITANGYRNGDLQFLNFPVFVDGGGDAGDSLNVLNKMRSTATTVTITADQVGNGASDDLFGATVGTFVQYTGLQNGTLLVDLGDDAATGNRFNVQSTSAGRTRLVGGPQFDAFHLNAFASTTELGSLDDVRGDVELEGRDAGGLDYVRISDVATTQGNGNILFESNRILGLAGPSDGTSIFYGNIHNIDMFGSNSDTVAEQYTLVNPAAILTLKTDAGPDTVNVRANSNTVTVFTEAGNDTIRVSSNAGSNDDGDLNQIVNQLFLDAGAGDNRLIVSNYGRPAGSNYEILNSQIFGTTPFPIQYAATGGRFYNGAARDGFLFRASNAGNDGFDITSTVGGSQTAVDGNGGNDNWTIQSDMLGGDVLFRGGAGNDAFTMEAGASGSLANAARVSGGGDKDTFLVNGFDGDFGADNGNVLVYDAVNGAVAGVGRAVDFDTLEAVTFDGRGGPNNLTFTDATNVAYGSIANPETGIVVRPSGSKSGEVFINNGTVGPQLLFQNINGPADTGLVINGDPSGTGLYRDVITIVGTSDLGRAAPGVLSGLTARSGADKITVSDQSVTVRNEVLGLLRPVALGRTNGEVSFTTLVVRGGNEVGTGDTVTVTPSRELSIFLDGGDPVAKKTGDRLVINGTGTPVLTRGTDPVTGLPLTSVTLPDDSSVGFIRFEEVDGLRSFFAIGADAGGGPRVRLIDPKTQEVLFDQFVYGESFRGGVRVATGDVTGDGIEDLVVAAGYGGGPHVQVFDGLTFQSVGSFYAYEANFTGGLYIAVGDVTGDGVAEIITGTGNGGGPLVRVFTAAGEQLAGFFAFEPGFRGGVRVAVGDVDGDGIDEIICAAGVGGGPLVRVFLGATGQELSSFFVGDPNSRNGLYVAAGDMDGDGAAEIISGPGGDESNNISIRKSRDAQTVTISVFDIGQIDSPKPLPSVATTVLSASSNIAKEGSGLRVATADLPDGSGRKQAIVSRGPGATSRVRGFSIDPIGEVGNFLAFEPTFEGGVFVG